MNKCLRVTVCRVLGYYRTIIDLSVDLCVLLVFTTKGA